MTRPPVQTVVPAAAPSAPPGPGRAPAPRVRGASGSPTTGLRPAGREHLPGLCSPPAVDEVHVFVSGLDPLAAAVCLRLAEAGVCLLNIHDPAPVSVADIRHGPYPAESEGQPRELVLRRELRRRAARCVPLSAPELFPSAAVPAAVVLRAGAVTGDLVTDLVEPEDPPLDGALTSLHLVTDGASAVTWPATDWAHRPCRGCLVAAARESRRVVRRAAPEGADPVPPGASSALAAITRTVVAGEVAGQLLGLALAGDAAAAPSLAADGHPSDMLVLRRGLARTRLAPDPGCLCALAFTGG